MPKLNRNHFLDKAYDNEKGERLRCLSPFLLKMFR